MNPFARPTPRLVWLALLLMVPAAAFWVLLPRADGPGVPQEDTGTPPGPAAAAASGEPARGTAFRGLVVAREAAQIESAYEARVETIQVGIGDRVIAGEIIATLDSRPVKLDLEAARASLAAARAERRKADAELEEAIARTARLRALGDIVSAQERDAAAAAERMLRAETDSRIARVAEAESTVTRLEEKLAAAEIRAPFDGTIASINVIPGATVRQGVGIAVLANVDDLVVRFAVPRERAHEVWTGLEVTFRPDDLAADIPGTVVQVSPEVDSTTGMLLCVADIDIFWGLQDRVPAGAAGRVYAGDAATPDRHDASPAASVN